MEKDALGPVLQESRGILYRLVAVVCSWKVQEPRLKQLVI